jgi:four helix bundle protein
MEYHTYSFEKLEVWKDIRELIKLIYVLTSTYPETEKFGLVTQMRRSVTSISSNLAEGSSRTSAKDQAHFYQISYSSSMELLSQLIVSLDLNYINEEQYSKARILLEKVSYKMNALRNSALKRT